jgi:hypothetical protein
MVYNNNGEGRDWLPPEDQAIRRSWTQAAF